MRIQVPLYPILMTTLRYSDLLEHVSRLHKPRQSTKYAQSTPLLQKQPIFICIIFLVTRTPPPATSLSSEDYSITGENYT